MICRTGWLPGRSSAGYRDGVCVEVLTQRSSRNRFKNASRNTQTKLCHIAGTGTLVNTGPHVLMRHRNGAKCALSSALLRRVKRPAGARMRGAISEGDSNLYAALEIRNLARLSSGRSLTGQCVFPVALARKELPRRFLLRSASALAPKASRRNAA
jgi:hypothetical protein